MVIAVQPSVERLSLSPAQLPSANSWSALDRVTTARPTYGHACRFIRSTDYIGSLSPEKIAQLNRALAVALDLTVTGSGG
jgi:hypothetical protein